jgi:hypothetical protein
MLQIQILNVVGFFGSMIGGYLIGPYLLCWNGGTVENSDLCFNPKRYISPDGWAFAIWGIIYSQLGMFVIYQALPASWVPSRNDELIFEDIGYNFVVNIIMNQLWIVIFSFSTLPAFILSLIEIIGLLASTVYMMMKSTRTSVNIWEWICLRAGMSIYSGWLTAATILTASTTLQKSGMMDPNLPFGNE